MAFPFPARKVGNTSKWLFFQKYQKTLNSQKILNLLLKPAPGLYTDRQKALTNRKPADA